MRHDGLRVMVIGAHPDDADVYASGTASKFVAGGARVVFVSMTNGDKGHRTMGCAELAARRKGETQAAARCLGLEDYVVLDHPDCELEATLENRRELTRLIRRFAPRLIFTHRTCDYHADHRACGTLVMDAAYLLGVPHWCPDVPVPDTAPAVFLMSDPFTTPRAIRPDVAVDVSDRLDLMADCLLCHPSQFLEWLPPEQEDALEALPAPGATLEERRTFIRRFWLDPYKANDARRFGLPFAYAEVFEQSEYGRQLTPAAIRDLFSF